MGQVAIELNGRTYYLGCEKGDEERLKALSAYVREKLDGVIREHGQAGETRLLVMTAIMIADELFDLKAALDGEQSAKGDSAKGNHKKG